MSSEKVSSLGKPKFPKLTGNYDNYQDWVKNVNMTLGQYVKDVEDVALREPNNGG